ncbi:hypothetical protein [Flavobacterium pectinovorum]|uniref:Lipoprotein n=1 Tax=Flavobacterium pectinovorum TaxID=29533 RepID=A0A502EK67_9FLAO|nr:hypothetical protein [Flavobacterium pectinovorum]TPG37504.1 hypothetical protein EAH81_18610 [Flavobacterium pectinovorum]
MKKHIIVLILATIGLSSCKKDSKSTPNSVNKLTLDSAKKKPSIYTQYTYTDSVGKSLIIQNSFPKGGTKYTDPNGEVYVYAVFWTRISNETNNPLELKINFPLDSYQIPSLPNEYFKIVVPSETMTVDKEALFNYGLKDLESLLDNNIHKSSSLKRTIKPKESHGFYVVLLSPINGAHGTLRTGFSLKGQNLFYKINDKEIPSGSINLTNLTLKK